jgi:hypothetical protein
MNGMTPATPATPATAPRVRPLDMHCPLQLLVIATAFLPALLPAAGRADVKVEKAPVAVETKTYDPKDPPKNVHLGEHEAGLTMSDFGCKIAFSLQPGDPRKQRNGKCQETLTVRSVKVIVDLKVTVWLPENANDKLKAHEQGHREMAETLYNERADKAAKAAGAVVDGKRFVAEADGCDQIDKAVEQTIGEINKKVYESYLTQTADASARAGDLYDEITAHGSNAVSEKAAAVQAFAKQAEEAKRAPGATTKPAPPGHGTNPAPIRQTLPK